MIEVWGRKNSFNVQKVLWCCGELDLPFERHDVGGLYGETDTPEYLARNPTGLVPTLSEDGFDLWESNTIVRYLAAKHGTGTLWPEDPQKRAVSEVWMDYWTGTVFPAFKATILGLIRTAPEGRDHDAIRASAEATTKALWILEGALADTEYVAGPELTMGDVALGPGMYRWFELGIDRPSMPNTEAWYRRLQERPAYREHVMIGLGMEDPSDATG